MPATQQRRWTATEVRALTADNPLHTPLYELLDGALLVTPSPTRKHNTAAFRLAVLVDSYVKRQGLGAVLTSPSDIELESESVVQPDVYVMSPAEARRPDFPVNELLLAIEVLSPSTARIDRGRKRRYYQRNGVSEYWIVDLDLRVVERWRPTDERPEILTDSLEWAPSGATEPLTIELPALFAEVLRDTA